uniref:Uncharacterized protein n=1 Tax=Rhizophora mucronata TaxID=61149 RepID=A0A2P2R1I2_RHIMU
MKKDEEKKARAWQQGPPSLRETGHPNERQARR